MAYSPRYYNTQRQFPPSPIQPLLFLYYLLVPLNARHCNHSHSRAIYQCLWFATNTVQRGSGCGWLIHRGQCLRLCSLDLHWHHIQRSILLHVDILLDLRWTEERYRSAERNILVDIIKYKQFQTAPHHRLYLPSRPSVYPPHASPAFWSYPNYLGCSRSATLWAVPSRVTINGKISEYNVKIFEGRI